MCTDHRVHGISRRNFTVMALAGAGVGLVPFGARAAAKIEAACVMCIDYRLVDKGVAYFDEKVGRRNFDIVALAGASLAGASSNTFAKTVPGFWQQMRAARDLHDINRVLVLDHMQCGAYWAEFNGGRPMEPDKELVAHHQMWPVLQQRFNTFDWGPKGPPPGGLGFDIISPEGRML